MFNAYAVGIAVNVGGNAVAAVRSLMSQFQALNQRVRNLNQTIAGLPRGLRLAVRAAMALGRAFSSVARDAQTMSGAVAAMGGAAALRGAARAVMGPNVTERSEMSQMTYSGLSRERIEAFRERARGLSRTHGDYSQVEHLQMLNEARSSTQDDAAVMALAPALADFRTNIGVALPHGANTSRFFYDALRVIQDRNRLYRRGADGQVLRDERGNPVVDVEGVRQELAYMAHATANTNGRVNPSTMFLAGRQMGGMMATMTPEAFYGFATEMQEGMGSQPSGTAMMSVAQQMLSGRTTQGVIRQMIQAGWVDPSKLRMERQGQSQHIVWDARALRDVDGFQSNPYEWLAARMRQEMARSGQNASQVALRMFGRQTAARLGENAVESFENMAKAVRAQREAMRAGSEQQYAAGFRQENPETVMRGLQSAWSDLMKAIGEPITQVALGYMNQMAGVLREWTAWAAANGAQVAAIADIVGSSGVLAVGMGLLIAFLPQLAAGAALFVAGAAAAEALKWLTGEDTGFKALAASLRWLQTQVAGFVEVAKQLGIVSRTPEEVERQRVMREMSDIEARDRLRSRQQSFGGRLNPRTPGPPAAYPSTPPEGTPGVRPMSFVPDAPSGGALRVEVPVNIDGREITRVVADRIGARGRLPPSSSRGFDGRMSPAFSGGTLST